MPKLLVKNACISNEVDFSKQMLKLNVLKRASPMHDTLKFSVIVRFIFNEKREGKKKATRCVGEEHVVDKLALCPLFNFIMSENKLKNKKHYNNVRKLKKKYNSMCHKSQKI